MSTQDDYPVVKHRHTPSIPQPSSFTSAQSAQTPFSHVPRFALIRDLATGVQTHAPVTYLFTDDPHPSLTATDDKARTVIVDLSADGNKVLHAESLSGEWQLVSAKLGTTARIASAD